MTLDWTLDAEAGSETANSYVTLDEAEQYFLMRSPAPLNWKSTVDSLNKSKALVTATRLIDINVEWDGEVASELQALLWPRLGLYNAKDVEIAGDEIPNELKYAVCEFADILLAVDKTSDLTTDGIASLSVGSVSIDFSDNQPPSRKVLPESVWDFIRRWGTRMDASEGSATIVRA